MAANMNDNENANANANAKTNNSNEGMISGDEIVAIVEQLSGPIPNEAIAESLTRNAKLFSTLAKAHEKTNLEQLGVDCLLAAPLASGLALELINKFPKPQSNQSVTMEVTEEKEKTSKEQSKKPVTLTKVTLVNPDNVGFAFEFARSGDNPNGQTILKLAQARDKSLENVVFHDNQDRVLQSNLSWERLQNGSIVYGVEPVKAKKGADYVDWHDKKNGCLKLFANLVHLWYCAYAFSKYLKWYIGLIICIWFFSMIIFSIIRDDFLSLCFGVFGEMGVIWTLGYKIFNRCAKNLELNAKKDTVVNLYSWQMYILTGGEYNAVNGGKSIDKLCISLLEARWTAFLFFGFFSLAVFICGAIVKYSAWFDFMFNMIGYVVYLYLFYYGPVFKLDMCGKHLSSTQDKRKAKDLAKEDIQLIS